MTMKDGLKKVGEAMSAYEAAQTGIPRWILRMQTTGWWALGLMLLMIFAVFEKQFTTIADVAVGCAAMYFIWRGIATSFIVSRVAGVPVEK